MFLTVGCIEDIVTNPFRTNGRGNNNNIDGVHAEVSGIAALPNKDYTASRVIYSHGAEFQKDGDTVLSPIGWLSDPENGVVFAGASPASKLCPTALPFILDAFDNPDEAFKADTASHCEFRILKIKTWHRARIRRPTNCLGIWISAKKRSKSKLPH